MKVTVIIPSYNRFRYVQDAIASVRSQTHKDVEIIVINDGSADPSYKNHDWGADVVVIHIPNNSRTRCGFPSAGFVRNQGLQRATGDLIAFLDDDDIWLPTKLEKQIAALEDGTEMVCTEAISGKGRYDATKAYKKWISEVNIEEICAIHARRGSAAWAYGVPDFFDSNLVSIHNAVISSSVLITANLMRRVGDMLSNVRCGVEDYDYWRRCIAQTRCRYLHEPLVYYDSGHGDGVNY